MTWWQIFLGSIFGFKFAWFVFLHILLIWTFFLRLIWVRRPVSVTFAWFLIVILLPLIGLMLYLMLGERPVGRKLTKKIIRMEKEYAGISEEMKEMYRLDRELLHPEARALSLLAQSKNGSPVTSGNKIELFTFQKLVNLFTQKPKTPVGNTPKAYFRCPIFW